MDIGAETSGPPGWGVAADGAGDVDALDPSHGLSVRTVCPSLTQRNIRVAANARLDGITATISATTKTASVHTSTEPSPVIAVNPSSRRATIHPLKLIARS